MSNYTFWSLLGPVAWQFWALVLVSVALVGWGARGVPFARTIAILGAISALAMLFLPIGSWLIAPLENRFPVVATASVAGTDIIVLAGGERLAPATAHGQPSFGEHNERTFAAAMLARRLPQARLWAVGGVRLAPGAPRDIDIMADAWRQLGIAPARIRLIGDTADTCGNARGAREQIRTGASLILVTSAFHMPRAMACFRAVGLEPLPYPVDFQTGSGLADFDPLRTNPGDNQLRFSLALHEYTGLIYYYAWGRIDDLWPPPGKP